MTVYQPGPTIVPLIDITLNFQAVARTAILIYLTTVVTMHLRHPS